MSHATNNDPQRDRRKPALAQATGSALCRGKFSARQKVPQTCPACGATVHTTKSGNWYRHFKPPMAGTSYETPLVHGPVCELSGKPNTEVTDAAKPRSVE